MPKPDQTARIAWLQRALDDRERLIEKAKSVIAEYEAMIEKTSYQLEVKLQSFERIRNIVDRLDERLNCNETKEMLKIIDQHDDEDSRVAN